MNEQAETMNSEVEKNNLDTDNGHKVGETDKTNLQENSAKTTDESVDSDNVSESKNAEKECENKSEKEQKSEVEDKPKEPSFEEKYAALNDSHLRLMAEYDNFRKRTLREKADLIKSGGATALTNLLPIIDDFERALETLKSNEKTDDVMLEGVKLIYDKFSSYLTQQGVKSIEAVGKPFDTEFFEAIATIPTPEADKKGKVLECIQTGYMLYDKVLRHAKVVVGE